MIGRVSLFLAFSIGRACLLCISGGAPVGVSVVTAGDC
jgi:hypothetical protein